MQPAPVGGKGQESPNLFSQGPGQMGHRSSFRSPLSDVTAAEGCGGVSDGEGKGRVAVAAVTTAVDAEKTLGGALELVAEKTFGGTLELVAEKTLGGALELVAEKALGGALELVAEKTLGGAIELVAVKMLGGALELVAEKTFGAVLELVAEKTLGDALELVAEKALGGALELVAVGRLCGGPVVVNEHPLSLQPMLTWLFPSCSLAVGMACTWLTSWLLSVSPSCGSFEDNIFPPAFPAAPAVSSSGLKMAGCRYGYGYGYPWYCAYGA